MPSPLLRICIFLKVIILIVLISACAPTKPTIKIPPRPTLGVMPFSGSHGDSYTNLLNTELRKCDFNVVERNRIEKIIAETGYQADEVFNLSSLSQIGRQLRVKFLLVGSTDSEESGVSGYANTKIMLRLIDLNKKEVTWEYHTEYWSDPLSKQGDDRRAAGHLAKIFCNDFSMRHK